MKIQIIRLLAGAIVLFTTTSVSLAITYTVTNTNDTLSAGTLRQAITDANAHANSPVGTPDRIHFSIPGNGPHTISPASALPTITDPVVIDGYTQGDSTSGTAADDALENTNPVGQGLNTVLKIELDGTNAGVGVSGLTITGGNSTIQGLIINRFANVGIALNSASNLVQGNFIGTNAAGAAALANGGQGVRIDSAADNIVGGTAPAARNLISGNAEGMEIRGVGSNNNIIRGNFIGTNAAGTGALGNLSNGVRVVDGTGTIVGGTASGARNIISGNQGIGVAINNSTVSGTLVQGNFIGTDVLGTADLGNTDDGVKINASSNNTIGGTASGAGNVISGNDGDGVWILGSTATGNLVQGNYIGTDVTGTLDLGNTFVGARMQDAPSNTIGGTVAGARNIISGNDENGVSIIGSLATTNLVQGNFIGTDVNGTADLGNTEQGVVLYNAPNNKIGGGNAGEGNVISGNGGNGVYISGATAQNNTISQNLIGLNAANTGALGNGGHGVFLTSSGPNTIGGGFNPGNANTIAHNGGDGVAIVFGTGPCIKKGIVSNSIFSNGGLGIDLEDDGVTLNDVGDGDTGANTLQNFPVLTSASTGGGNTTINGSLNSTASTSFHIEFFASAAADPTGYGEGQTFLGYLDVMTDSGGNVTFTAVLPVLPPAGQTIISATTTDNAELANTSEFSNVVQIAGTAGIAFRSSRDGNQEIYVMNADGTNQTRLTNDPGADEEPRFSFDGTRIVFQSDRDGNSEIYVMNADGTGQTRLTNDTGANAPFDSVASFSPDGTRIVFVSNREDVANNNFDVYIMNADGTNITRLTNDPALDSDPRFSPDGTKILFSSERGGTQEIYVMNANGTGQAPLTDSGPNFYPSFSPDGTRIVFNSFRDGNVEVYIMDADGTNQTRLTNNSFADNFAVFSPNGAQIAFASNRDGNYEIYVMDVDGTNQTRLTNIPQTDIFPSWAVTGTAGQLQNISTRGRVLTGDNVMIGGFIITGAEAKTVILRAIGPSLANANPPVPGALANPTLSLHDGNGALIVSNDDWKINDQTQQSQEAEVTATGLAPTNDFESAIVRTLSPGAYTGIVSGKNGTTGVGLVEVFDLSPNSNSTLANISTRGFVDTGDNVLIGGVIVGGGGGGSVRVIVRAIGPSLSSSGISNPLQDPVLELHDSNGALLITNDNWKTTQQTEIEATGLAPTNDAESAIVFFAPPGSFTAIVRGNNDTTGVGLVEVFNVE